MTGLIDSPIALDSGPHTYSVTHQMTGGRQSDAAAKRRACDPLTRRMYGLAARLGKIALAFKYGDACAEAKKRISTRG